MTHRKTGCQAYEQLQHPVQILQFGSSDIMRAQIPMVCRHLAWNLVTCQIRSLDRTAETLEFDLKSGLKHVNWDEWLSDQNTISCKHMIDYVPTGFEHRLPHEF